MSQKMSYALSFISRNLKHRRPEARTIAFNFETFGYSPESNVTTTLHNLGWKRLETPT